MTLIYSFVIHLLYLIIWAISPFNPKARLWISGRMGWRNRLQQKLPGKPVFWFHAASLGEFEQGRPLIEAIKKKLPQCTVVLTFYSPSGFEIRKNYPEADLVCYLPLDTSCNAKRFISLIRPDAAFFIKYEYWYFYLRALHNSNIPVYLVSGLFRQDQTFFRWYGGWFRKKLRFINHFFVQDQSSASLLQSHGFHNVSVSGDTRFDRVSSLARVPDEIAGLRAFVAGGYCLVAGSTWPRDEEILIRFINETGQNIKMVIAPHEIHQQHILRLTSHIMKKYVRFSQAREENLSEYQVLIMDNIGMLSSLYRYGQIAFIGGGFGTGIHNILEPAVNGLPVVFGPNYRKFREAIDLIEAGGAFAISSPEEFHQTVHALMNDPVKYTAASSAAKRYVSGNTGATERIMSRIKVLFSR
ncbi:MAG: 3-deoxy-D-manno-octulosonic acid transferase [Bacteroidales bacterium]|nr:3-deoxy-D-manno-octulosonic acid transferase [Bacteroidales bacterium]